MNTKKLSAALITLMASGVAVAGTIRTNVEADATVQSPGFVQLDSNGDGSLDKREISADSHLRANWNRLDENDDGAVSQSEFSAFEAANLQERADRLKERADERADRMEHRAEQMQDRAEERN